jgi:hypothetical protein
LQQQQQQPSAWRTGLLLSCFKALTKGLHQHSAHPLIVLWSVAGLASLCPGLGTLADSAHAACPFPEDAASSTSGSAAFGSGLHVGAAAATRCEVTSGLPWGLQNCLITLLRLAPATQAGRASSSSSSSCSSSSSSSSSGVGAVAVAVRDSCCPACAAGWQGAACSSYSSDAAA